MADKKIKKVTIAEGKLVDLIHSIVEKTIAERVEAGELTEKPVVKKTRKVTVTESQLAKLVKSGKVLSVRKK